MYKQSIGIIGGFGAYATLDFYKRFLEKFSSDCERNYPHIYMDNNYTMPSRTRALLYGDDYEKIVEDICDSVQYMLEKNVDYIVLVCGTAHAFLPKVYDKLPQAQDKILNIIDCLKKKLFNENVKKILVVAAEGTLKKRIYESELGGLSCISPLEEDYAQIRSFIEAVKQNRIDEKVVKEWFSFLEKFQCDNVLLGCTELPVLVKSIHENYKKYEKTFNYFDPLEEVLDVLKYNIK